MNRKRLSFFQKMDCLIATKRKARKNSTADLYRATRNWLWKFTEKRDLPLSLISPSFVNRFFDFLQALPLRPNTIYSYLSAFRSMYNQITREIGHITRKYPFAHLSIHLEKTSKRAIPLDVLEKIHKLNLQHEPELRFTADLCIFSFLACGIPFVDLAHLTYKNIEGNTLVYHRTKTRTLIRIELTEGMRSLIAKYSGINQSHLFPILPENMSITHEKYKYLLRTYNKRLKELGRRLNMPTVLTSYVIRHTWATEAQRRYVPISIISQALGHTSEKTTRYYLAQLDVSVLGKANRLVVNSIDKLVSSFNPLIYDIRVFICLFQAKSIICRLSV